MKIKRILFGILSAISFVSFCRAEGWEPGKTYTSLSTDRYSYVSGDIAFFKLYGFFDEVPVPDQAVYVDLVTNEESFITGAVVQMVQGMASGYLVIPDSLPSGKYYLRLYSDQTKKLENPFWDKKQIYVSNRFGKNKSIDNSYYEKELPETNLHEVTGTGADFCKILIKKDTFETRCKVEAQLKFRKENGMGKIWASLTVKPISPIEKKYTGLNTCLPAFNQGLIHMSQKSVKPGVVLKGQVKPTGNSGIPLDLSAIVVFLSLKDSIFRFFYSFPDEQGNFCFYLNKYTGDQLLYLSAFQRSDLSPLKDIQFEVTNNFIISNNSKIPQHEVLKYRTVTDSLNILKSIITKAYQNQVALFDMASRRDTCIWTHKYVATKFTDIVYPDDYVNLPDLIEIAKEILPLVRYRNTSGTKTMVVVDKNTIRENPLVFVDGVPLVEIEKIEGLSSSEIRCIEVKSEPRAYGDFLFKNGFIFIWTKKIDFWETTRSDYIFTYQMQCYQNPITFTYPDYPNTNNHNIPDYRQTLYWNPEIVIDNQVPVNINFFTSDETGDFEILLQGISSEGIPINVSKIITVE